MCACLRWHDPNLDIDPLRRLPRFGTIERNDALTPQVAFIEAKRAKGERPVAPLPRGRRCRRGLQPRELAAEARPAAIKAEPAWRGAAGGVVEIVENGATERVVIDAKRGPEVYLPDGSIGYLPLKGFKRWDEMPSSDQKLQVYTVMRRNREMIELRGEAFWRPELRKTPEQLVQERCAAELAKPPARWQPIGRDEVLNGYTKRAPGMIYGMEFPWNAELLLEFGPEWLTHAMHAAGTLDQKNRVTSITLEEKIKVTGGNNAGKFLFEVTYARQEEHLHRLLFAKVPFAMTKETQNDRISSSVMKQPSDLQEINTYRLLEASLPVKTPKYYYGDISNENSNFILITERIPFGGTMAYGRRKPAPWEVEGPYDKCKDWQLQGPPEEYYTLLMRASAWIAAGHKTGRILSQELLNTNHFNPLYGRDSFESWGVNPWAGTGEVPAGCFRKLEAAYRFIGQIAKPLFPEYAATDEFRKKFMNTLMTWNAYRAEIECWKNADPDYVALGHMNLNADNAYYWRDANGQLECGVIDWGGFGINSVGHKLWWIINCADFGHVGRCWEMYVDIFVAAYQEAGGPALDREVMKMQLILTSLGNTMFMVAAVPNCYTMCSAEEFASITDINDPRVAENIFGKSTLRTTLHVMNNGIRVIEELGGDQFLDNFIENVFTGNWGFAAKSSEMIFGNTGAET